MALNLIVGGTGFVGGHLAEYFFEQGELSKAIFRRGALIRILDQGGVENYEGDLLDRESLHEPLHGVEVVYNLASAMPGDQDGADYSVNDRGVRNMLMEAMEHGVKTFVHLSTLDVYGFRGVVDETTEPGPADPYQSSKLGAERILAEFGRDHPEMKVKIVRAARAVGPRDMTLTAPLLAMGEAGKVVIPARRGGRMSLTHPKDIAQALHRAATSASPTRTWLVKSFDAGIFEYSEGLNAACGLRASVREQGLLSGRSVFPVYTAEQIRGGLLLREQQRSWKELGYVPAYDLARVCTEVKEWHEKEPWVTAGFR